MYIVSVLTQTVTSLTFSLPLAGEYMPPDRVHPGTFKGSNRMFRKPKAHLLHAQRHNAAKTPESQRKALTRVKSRHSKTKQRLSDLGIDYDFPEVKAPEGGTAGRDAAEKEKPKKRKVTAIEVADSPEKKKVAKTKKEKQIATKKEKERVTRTQKRGKK